ncbi:MAG TPA: hypothetical protein VEV84_05225 [Pyrinomonadaceae bacterium]|nr:hypothetical protein [Pyrinomonadaceae bacterium]
MDKVLQKTSGTRELKSKKDMILSLFKSGVTEIETIAAVSGAKPSYVGSVLHKMGLVDNYFDLYTSTGYPMNVYSKHFRGKLGFRDVETAKRGVRTLENGYQYFSRIQDRAGQHHTLELGLTMLDRARWTAKLEEAEIYRQWLVGKLSVPLVEAPKPSVLAKAEATAKPVEEAVEEEQWRKAA